MAPCQVSNQGGRPRRIILRSRCVQSRSDSLRLPRAVRASGRTQLIDQREPLRAAVARYLGSRLTCAVSISIGPHIDTGAATGGRQPGSGPHFAELQPRRSGGDVPITGARSACTSVRISASASERYPARTREEWTSIAIGDLLARAWLPWAVLRIRPLSDHRIRTRPVHGKAFRVYSSERASSLGTPRTPCFRRIARGCGLAMVMLPTKR